MNNPPVPRFRLARQSDDPTLPAVFRQVDQPPPSTTDQADHTRSFAELRRQVGCIWLVHGTFVGNDTLGLCRDLGRVFPQFAIPMRKWQKQLLDALLGERGNYSQKYAECLTGHLSDDGSIPVRLFHWSSENHHIGRADAAIRLVRELVAQSAGEQRRILILSHSHGGNVLALLSNLIGGSPESIARFFELSRLYWQPSWSRNADMTHWPIVKNMIEAGKLESLRNQIDFVTFGTPVLYGWEPRGFRSLMHIIHHRPAKDGPPDRVPFPFSVDDFRHARHGDYIQQLGIAGTSISPGWLQWRARRADKRLGRWLLPDQSRRNLLKRLRDGVRTHRQGHNVLVDYFHDHREQAAFFGGHAVYTSTDWIPYHLSLINEFLYSQPADVE